MAVTTDSFTEGRLHQRLGRVPPRRPDGAYELPGANLARLLLSKAQLAGANLQGASLAGADLRRAALTDTDLRRADLAAARLQQADLRRADLREANLRLAVLDSTLVSGARLAGANLEGATFRAVALWETDLTPTDLVGARVWLHEAIAAVEPSRVGADAALEWCAALGDSAVRATLRQLLNDRRWRRRLAALTDAIRAIETRIGPLSEASISRAGGPAPGARSLSPAEPGPSQPDQRSLSTRRRRPAGADEPSPDDDSA